MKGKQKGNCQPRDSGILIGLDTALIYLNKKNALISTSNTNTCAEGGTTTPWNNRDSKADTTLLHVYKMLLFFEVKQNSYFYITALLISW